MATTKYRRGLKRSANKPRGPKARRTGGREVLAKGSKARRLARSGWDFNYIRGYVLQPRGYDGVYFDIDMGDYSFATRKEPSIITGTDWDVWFELTYYGITSGTPAQGLADSVLCFANNWGNVAAYRADMPTQYKAVNGTEHVGLNFDAGNGNIRINYAQVGGSTSGGGPLALAVGKYYCYFRVRKPATQKSAICYFYNDPQRTDEYGNSFTSNIGNLVGDGDLPYVSVCNFGVGNGSNDSGRVSFLLENFSFALA